MNKANSRRTVIGIDYVGIIDDFGSYMEVGNVVEVHAMPFDTKHLGVLSFDKESCSFFIKHKYGKTTLSHEDEWQDMGACIKVTKSFRLFALGEKNEFQF